MQIANPSTSASVSRDDDEEDSITLTVVPTQTPTASEPGQTPADGDGQGQEQGEEEVSPIQMFYNAVSACSNLHPDPVLPGDEDYDVEGDGDEEEGAGEGEGEEDDAAVQTGLPPPMPGSSGWITAENMHEYFDEEGNWIAGGQEPSFPLGPGAGTVRQRDESGIDGDGDGDGDDDGDAGNAAGHGDGLNEETKWQRTD